jgi:hypothetical protein
MNDPLKQARDRFKQSQEAEAQLRMRMLEDQRFRVPENQWPESIKRMRDSDGRPCLSMDRIGQFIHQVVNEVRQNKTAPKVTPVDDDSDVETAEILEGIYRKVERQSKADIARNWAAEHSISVGRGWYRIVTDYEADDSFDQDIFIRRIKHQSSVYPDPSCNEPDYSDMEYCFVVEDLTAEEYKQRFPKSDLIGLDDFSSIGDRAPGWLRKDSVRIAEYFFIEREKVKIQQVSAPDGTVSAIRAGDPLPEGYMIVVDQASQPRVREVQVKRVKWQLINGAEVLEERDWPGKYIPVVAILGEEMVVDGETVLSGMVRRGMDAQRQFNYMRSAMAESVALAPRAPFVAAVGQTEKFSEWKTANSRNHAVLRFDPVSVGGTVMPAPQRVMAEPAIQGITTASQWAVEDMKGAYGMYDASLGARSNEHSGVAIQARQREGDNANFHYIDAVNVALNHEARIVLDLIPKIYDRPGRVARIIGAEGQEKTVRIGDPQQGNGIYDLSSGRYDISITLGPSYQTKRQEAADAMLQLAGQMPIIGNVAPDLVVKNLDVPGALELEERLKKSLPPGIADDKGDPMAMAQASQAKLQQAMQMVDMLTQQVNALHQERESKMVEISSRERIAEMQEHTKREIALATLDQNAGMELLKQDLQATKHKLDMMHQALMKGADHEHAVQVKQMDQAHQQDTAQQAQAAQQEQADQAPTD